MFIRLCLFKIFLKVNLMYYILSFFYQKSSVFLYMRLNWASSPVTLLTSNNFVVEVADNSIIRISLYVLLF